MIKVFKTTPEAVQAVTRKLFSDAGLDPDRSLPDGKKDWETEADAVREELRDLTFKLNQLFTETTAE